MWPGRDRSCGHRVRVDDRPDRAGTVRRRDPGGDAAPRVDRDGERRVSLIRVVGHHQRDLQLVEAFTDDGHADHTARVPNDERDRLGRHLLRRHDQIALVLPVGIVDDDHHPSGADVFDRLRDGRERRRLRAGLLLFAHRHRPSIPSAIALVITLAIAVAISPAMSRSTYFAITSTSRFTRSPGTTVPNVVTSERVRDQRHLDAFARDRRDRETHAVHRDGPLLHDVAEQSLRHADRDHGPAIVVAVQAGDLADPVDVPLHEVPAEPGGERDRSLEVHRIAGREPAQGRSVERLRRQVEREVAGASRDHRQAHPVDRDRGSDVAVGDDGPAADHEPGRAGLEHDAPLLNDPGEHPPPPSGRLRSVPTLTMRSSRRPIDGREALAHQDPGRVRAADQLGRQIQHDPVDQAVVRTKLHARVAPPSSSTPCTSRLPRMRQQVGQATRRRSGRRRTTRHRRRQPSTRRPPHGGRDRSWRRASGPSRRRRGRPQGRGPTHRRRRGAEDALGRRGRGP